MLYEGMGSNSKFFFQKRNPTTRIRTRDLKIAMISLQSSALPTELWSAALFSLLKHPNRARERDWPNSALFKHHVKVAERSKALVSGTSLLGGVGSNPILHIFLCGG